ncbi:hypothetical protein NQ318_004754 [Aromia moschata]|uniref:Uncharacterized protein n=1 Tax=Aromia moschata TaxID=1265417 RepID=A0AAV8XW01_9CUCU|nr:hypothetical protein NQ318_004754 [Aromia moschata]
MRHESVCVFTILVWTGGFHYLGYTTMKFLIVLVAVALAANALSDREQWDEFKLKHGKSYRNLAEETRRFAIFQDNLRVIEQHNAKYERGETSFARGVNRFTDMTKEEIKKLLNRKPSPKTGNTMTAAMINATVADSLDWRAQGAVATVKDQGDCGSCWAFAAVGAMESAYYMKNGQLVQFSEQQLIDCTTSYGTVGCDGGFMQGGFEYAHDNGISTEDAYPYAAKDQSCQSTTVFLTISSFVQIEQNEDTIKSVVGTVGPVGVAIYADDIVSYSSGVYDNPSCPNSSEELDHEVLLVGYGSENGQDYWLIKNSWGTNWGESGYIKLARNSNMCGIAQDSAYPVL